MKKKVYICASMKGEVREVVERINGYTAFALKSNVAPVAPQMYLQCMHTEPKIRKEIVDETGKSLLWFCDEMWIFGEEVTEQMQQEIQFCKVMNIRARKVSEKEVNELLGGNK